jgi:magnesium-transporting ATPase (P-type)
MRALEQITRKTHSEKDSIRAIPSSTVEAMLIQSNLMERPPRQPLLTFPLFMRTGLVSLLTLGGAFVPFAWENSQGASLAEARTALVNVIVFVQLFYLFNCRWLTGSSSLATFSNLWLLAGVAAMIAAQMAFTYVAFMNEAFHSAPSLLVGFEKRVRGQDEKNQAAGPNNRPMPQPSQR